MVLHAHTFEAFFQGWLINQESYLGELLRAIECNEENEIHCKELIERVMVHYNEYFVAKAGVLWENVLLVLTPTWFSSFERTYLWIGGFRPGLAFRLVVNNVFDLTQDQSQMIDRLMAEVKEEEKGLSDEFNSVQERMVSIEKLLKDLSRIQSCIQQDSIQKTSPEMLELAMHLGQLQNGAKRNMESAVDQLMASMEALVEGADFLRKKTGVMLVNILKPSQAVRFAAAAANPEVGNAERHAESKTFGY